MGKRVCFVSFFESSGGRGVVYCGNTLTKPLQDKNISCFQQKTVISLGG